MNQATPIDTHSGQIETVGKVAPGGQNIPLRVLIAIAASIALSLVAFGLATMAGATMLVTTPAAPAPIQIIPGQLVVSLALPMLIVGSLVWWLGRARPAIVRWAAWAGLAVGVLTAASPFSATSNMATAVGLSAMHVIAGAAWFVALLARPRRRQG